MSSRGELQTRHSRDWCDKKVAPTSPRHLPRDKSCQTEGRGLRFNNEILNSLLQQELIGRLARLLLMKAEDTIEVVQSYEQGARRILVIRNRASGPAVLVPANRRSLSKMKKILAVLGVALGLASAPGFASPLMNCSNVTSIGGWEVASSVCAIGDKKFTLLSTDLGSTFAIDFTTNGALDYAVTLGSTIGASNSDVSKYITYLVTVLDPTHVIRQVQLDSDIAFTASSPGDTTVKKRIGTGIDSAFDVTGLLDELVSTNGLPDSFSGLSNTSLYIRDTLLLKAGDQFNSLSNSITQFQVPEPGMLSLFGVMLAAGGFFGTRRRRS